MKTFSILHVRPPFSDSSDRFADDSTAKKKARMQFRAQSVKKVREKRPFLTEWEQEMKMLKREREQRQAIEMMCVDMLVPGDHLLRKIDAAVDFTRIYDLVGVIRMEYQSF